MLVVFQSAVRCLMIIDFHNDTILKIFCYDFPFYTGHKDLEIDFPKLCKANIDAMFFAFCTSPVYSKDESLKLLKELRRCMDEKIIMDKQYFEIAKDGKNLCRIISEKKRAAFLSIEGAYSVEKEQDIDELYNMDFRLITLTHTKSTKWAGSDSTTDGLSSDGKNIIKRMNELKIIIDLAHTSKQTIKDVTAISKQPVVVSHCGVKALNDSLRALDDESLQRVIDTGGIIGVSFFPEHLRMAPTSGLKEYQKGKEELKKLLNNKELSEREKYKPYLDISYYASKSPENIPGVEAVFNTIDYLVCKFGDNHVAIGSDFDGIPYGCNNFDDISKLNQLINIMKEKGYSTNSVDKICGENIKKTLG